MSDPVDLVESGSNIDAGAYEPISALNLGITNAIQAAAAGLAVSIVQNSLQKHNAGAKGIFTRTGGVITLFTAVGAAFGFTDAFVSNTREDSGGYSKAAAGCASGLVVGASMRSVPRMFGSCAGLGTAVGAFEATRGTLIGLPPRNNRAERLGEISMRDDQKRRQLSALQKPRPEDMPS